MNYEIKIKNHFKKIKCWMILYDNKEKNKWERNNLIKSKEKINKLKLNLQ
jgi:hypothetical protein